MKFHLLMSTFVLASAMTANVARASEILTDEMALEAGMTPVEELGSNQRTQRALEALFNSMEMDTTSTPSNLVVPPHNPSQEDIARAIESNRLVIVVNKQAKGTGAQMLTVYENGVVKPLLEDGVLKNSVKISTGREKKEKAKSGRIYISTTPVGFFRPERVYTMYYSNTWKADMPNAVFFCSKFGSQCGIATHATTKSHYAELGTRASGGCVRTKLEVSKQLREIVMNTGLGIANYKKVTESYRRDKVTGNAVSVDNVDRKTGAMTGEKVMAWDTLIVVHE